MKTQFLAIRNLFASYRIKRIVNSKRGLKWDAFLLSVTYTASKRNQHNLAEELLKWLPERTAMYKDLAVVVEANREEWERSDESGYLLETELGDLAPGKKLSATQMLKFWKEDCKDHLFAIELY